MTRPYAAYAGVQREYSGQGTQCALMYVFAYFDKEERRVLYDCVMLDAGKAWHAFGIGEGEC